MAHLRKMNNGRWQASVRLPDGRRRSATRDTRGQAREWADHTEAAARLLADANSAATFTWTAAGLDIHIPDDQITMDAAVELERALARVLNGDS